MLWCWGGSRRREHKPTLLIKIKDICFLIKVESDSAVLIKAIQTRSSLAGLYGILSDTSVIASSFEFISFRWISRDKNVVADSLAKHILSVEIDLIAPPNPVWSNLIQVCFKKKKKKGYMLLCSLSIWFELKKIMILRHKHV